MAIVKKTRIIPYAGKVYDLCVENTHTYNIEGLAVHNSAGGSLVSHVLGITDVDPIKYGLLFERFLDSSRASPPDIDVDFDPKIREWVKHRIVELFGEDHVCSIGTYQTYKTRAVILDVARALNENVQEANEVTKLIDPLEAFEDEEGEDVKVDKMSFDELCKHYPELKVYFDAHPIVRHHAEILRNQVKNMGTHAGGVIISDINLKGKIPVLYDKAGSEDRKVISAWAEAGGNEELSSVGLVKYDILGLSNLPLISDCIKFIESNQGKKIKRSDIPIDDRISILMGSKKDLVGIFQLDNPATKPVADAVGMESLNDVAAVTSLIRPGPRDMGMDMEYAKRKHGEPYTMPEVVKNLLLDTYGVIVFQEQIMTIAQNIGGISPSDSYKFLKICAKKQADQFPIWRDKFITGSQKLIDEGKLTKDDVESLVDQLSTFANYGFNKSVDKNALVLCENGVKKIGDVIVGDKVFSFDGSCVVQTDVVANHDHGVLPAFEVEFEGNIKVVCSIFHKFETLNGKMPLWKLILNKNKVAHLIPTKSGNVSWKNIVSARFVGFRQMCDLEVSHPSHNFALANGIITSNSHAIAYSAVSTCELWLRYHYPTEYLTSLINNTKLGKKKHGADIFVNYIAYARRNGIDVVGPDVNKSGDDFRIENGKIRFSISHVKSVATMAPIIQSHQPFVSLADFYERAKQETVNAKTGKVSFRRPNKKVIASLIEAGAFDCFGKRNEVVAEYFKLRNEKDEEPPQHTDDEWVELEKEAIGMCLSVPPICKSYTKQIEDNGWKTLSQLDSGKRIMVFGKIESIVPKTSKTGNPMYIVKMTDGIDDVNFFVFKSAQENFKTHFRVGTIAAVPLDKFEDGDARFYNDRTKPVIVVK